MGKPSAEAETLEAMARRWVSLWQGADLALCDSLRGEAFVSHGSMLPEQEGGDRFKEEIEALREIFPDFQTEILDLILHTETKKIVILWEATGTHKRHFLEMPPTEGKVTFTGIDILHIKAGKVVEHWRQWDGLGLANQIRRAHRTSLKQRWHTFLHKLNDLLRRAGY